MTTPTAEERAREWAEREVNMTLDSPRGVAPEDVDYDALAALVQDARKFAALGYLAGYAARGEGWISGKEALPPSAGEYEVRCTISYFDSYEGLQWGTPFLWDGDFHWRPLPAQPEDRP